MICRKPISLLRVWLLCLTVVSSKTARLKKSSTGRFMSGWQRSWEDKLARQPSYTDFNFFNHEAITMTIQRDPSGCLQIESTLMGESLRDKSLLASTDTIPIHRLMPDLVVVKVGGQSIIDRGRVALLPILDELVRSE